MVGQRIREGSGEDAQCILKASAPGRDVESWPPREQVVRAGHFYSILF